MTDSDVALVRILAAEDALRLPIRDWYGNHTAVNRAAGLKLRGVPFRVQSRGDEAGRKASEKLLVAMAAKKLLTITRSRRVRFPLLRLTEAGELRARELCELPGIVEGFEFLWEAAERESACYDSPPPNAGRWVPEIAFNDGRGWGDEHHQALGGIELRFLPAATRGWVEANSDCRGHVGYRVTDSGRTALAAGEPAEPLNLPEPDPDAWDLYREEQDKALDMLHSEKPSTNDIDTLPLSTLHFATAESVAKLPPRPVPDSEGFSHARLEVP